MEHGIDLNPSIRQALRLYQIEDAVAVHYIPSIGREAWEYTVATLGITRTARISARALSEQPASESFKRVWDQLSYELTYNLRTKDLPGMA